MCASIEGQWACRSALARDIGTAVFQTDRVIVHRGQARSYRIQ